MAEALPAWLERFVAIRPVSILGWSGVALALSLAGMGLATWTDIQAIQAAYDAPIREAPDAQVTVAGIPTELLMRGSFSGALFSGMGLTWGLVMFGIQATRPR